MVSFLADRARQAIERPIVTVVAQHKDKLVGASAVVDNVLDELKSRYADLGEKDLLQGRIQVYSTVDAGCSRFRTRHWSTASWLYEKRHPGARGLTQGSVVVLRNRDASVLAETGGRQSYKDRSSAYSDFNRVTKSLRQPGSAMKPIVYLAAFRERKIRSRYRGARRTHQRPQWRRAEMRNGSPTTMESSRA